MTKWENNWEITTKLKLPSLFPCLLLIIICKHHLCEYYISTPFEPNLYFNLYVWTNKNVLKFFVDADTATAQMNLMAFHHLIVFLLLLHKNKRNGITISIGISTLYSYCAKRLFFVINFFLFLLNCRKSFSIPSEHKNVWLIKCSQCALAHTLTPINFPTLLKMMTTKKRGWNWWKVWLCSSINGLLLGDRSF